MWQLNSVNFLHLLYILIYHFFMLKRIQITLVFSENPSSAFNSPPYQFEKGKLDTVYSEWTTNSLRWDYFTILIMPNPGKGGYWLGVGTTWIQCKVVPIRLLVSSQHCSHPELTAPTEKSFPHFYLGCTWVKNLVQYAIFKLTLRWLRCRWEIFRKE